MRPCYGAGVADQHHPAVDIGVYEVVVDRLDRHLFERALPDHGLIVGGESRGEQLVEVRVELTRHLTGRDRGRLGEVQPWGLWGVDPPVHPAVSWVGAVVKV